MRGLHLPKRVLVLAAAASIAVGGTTAMAAHILTAGPNIFLRRLDQKGVMPLLNLEAEDISQIGIIENYSDFTWKSLFDDFSCTECARCSNYCPAYNTGKPLSPMQVVHDLRDDLKSKMPDRGPLDLLRAAFPGGSVTGAPKVRAMEVIAELEPTARGPYCGCLGYVGFDGSMDTNILIRTFTCGGGWVQFPVGGGVVADSDPAREYEETLHKAAGLLRALE